MDDNVHMLGEQKCPYCGRRANAAGATDGETNPPKPGDVCICIKCASLQLVGENLELQKVTPEFLEELKSNEELWKELMRLRRATKALSFAERYRSKWPN